jgi:organic anion transporter 4A
LKQYKKILIFSFRQPEGVSLTPDDNSWVGAWWLGYFFGGILSLIAAIPLFGFPSYLPNIRALQAEKRLAKDSVPDDEKPHTLKEFLPALKSIFKNKVFLFTTIAVTAEGFHITGATFFPKFIESQYDLSSSEASLYTGGVVVPGAAVGMLFGGYLIRRFQWTCKQCIQAAAVVSFISALALFVFLVHCPNKHIVGVTTSNLNR